MDIELISDFGEIALPYKSLKWLADKKIILCLSSKDEFSKFDKLWPFSREYGVSDRHNPSEKLFYIDGVKSCLNVVYPYFLRRDEKISFRELIPVVSLKFALQNLHYFNSINDIPYLYELTERVFFDSIREASSQIQIPTIDSEGLIDLMKTLKMNNDVVVKYSYRIIPNYFDEQNMFNAENEVLSFLLEEHIGSILKLYLEKYKYNMLFLLKVTDKFANSDRFFCFSCMTNSSIGKLFSAMVLNQMTVILYSDYKIYLLKL